MSTPQTFPSRYVVTASNPLTSGPDYSELQIKTARPYNAIGSMGKKSLNVWFAGTDAENERLWWSIRLGFHLTVRGPDGLRMDPQHTPTGRKPLYVERLVAEGYATLGTQTGTAGYVVDNTYRFADAVSIETTSAFGTHIQSVSGKSLTAYSPGSNLIAALSHADIGDPAYVLVDVGPNAASGGSAGASGPVASALAMVALGV